MGLTGNSRYLFSHKLGFGQMVFTKMEWTIAPAATPSRTNPLRRAWQDLEKMVHVTLKILASAFFLNDLKFHKFQPRYSYKIYSYIKESVSHRANDTKERIRMIY